MTNQKIFSSFIEICDPLQLFHFHSKRIKSIAQGKEAGSMAMGSTGSEGSMVSGVSFAACHE